MARIFNIYFNYSNTMHTAIVAVHQLQDCKAYVFKPTDKNLNNLLPGNTIISPTPQQFHFPNASKKHPPELMNAIIDAVAKHVDATFV